MHPAFNSANLVGWALPGWREMRWVQAQGALLCPLGHVCKNWGMRGGRVMGCLLGRPFVVLPCFQRRQDCPSEEHQLLPC